ncbi:hypothetical protein QJS10_CPB18g01412 [Acorus calamus]|uniref:KIB1-4 beta-propeller domain-containing protein n=1 Tax=Acorus calamus TaxID=4465 RepID=A0AAV9CNI2_ACOCL|nr:hypothetical protein QJS10_CPB18g01412 [Acorus calamus]
MHVLLQRDMAPGGWSELPKELLYLIETRLMNLSDRVLFAAACKSWRSALKESPNRSCSRREFPWLMLPGGALYSPLEDKVRSINLPNRHHFQRFLGSSSDGWVAMVDESLNVYLFNPISGAEARLPSLTNVFLVMMRRLFTHGSWMSSLDVRDIYLRKAVWSPDPNNLGSVSMVLLMKCMVAVNRPGNARWTVRYGQFIDVIYNKEIFYLVDQKGQVFTLNINDIHERRVWKKWKPWNMDLPMGSNKLYLVEGPSSLLLVIRLKKFPGGCCPYRTTGFKVFELNEGTMKWERKVDLGDGMLFLGMNSSIHLSASHFPECQGNRIYFTDDNMAQSCSLKYGGYDMGVFCLGDGSLGCPYRTDERSMWPDPIWIFPNPTGNVSTVCRCTIRRRLLYLFIDHLPRPFYFLDARGRGQIWARLLRFFYLYCCIYFVFILLLEPSQMVMDAVKSSRTGKHMFG